MMHRTFKENIVLFSKGIAMGAADVVPGVSGGTIAFISGIYEELLSSIRSINGKALQLLASFKIKEFWAHINGNFLVVLLAGIGTSVVSLSRIIVFLLSNYPEMLWSFFFGLVVASALVVSRKITKWTIGVVIAGLIGTAIAYYITVASPAETPTSAWFIFLSGAIAICAMILPGISGSFILVLLGKYEYILNAVKDLSLSTIITFALGCIVGILSFSHILNWMLKRYFNVTVALLTGFMIGSLNKVWPWKQVLTTYTTSKGELKPLLEQNVSPLNYLELTGKEPYLIACILLAVFGFVLVYFLERFTARKEVYV
jgi:putative membrane protein